MDDSGDTQTRQVIWYVPFLFHTPSMHIIRRVCVANPVVTDHLFPVHVVLASTTHPK